MTAIIVGQSSGLTTTTGMSTGPGLNITPGAASGYGILFVGAGGMAANISRQGFGAFITLPGGPAMSTLPSGRYLTNPATFSGTGSLAYLGSLGLMALMTLSGQGGKVN